MHKCLKAESSGKMFGTEKYRVIQNDCQGFNNLSYTIAVYVFFYLTEQHSKFL